MNPAIVKRVRRLAGCVLPLGLLMLIVGCAQRPTSVEHAEVSGKILIQGKALPGGQVSFVAVKGGFAASGNIDENGNYQIKAPVGDVIITVNNSMLQGKGGTGKGGPVMKGGAKAPKELPHPKEGAEEQPIKGHWMSIPSRYSNADTSDLKYTVKPGPQTHDINLSTATPPPSGSTPGS